jgi:hypothetical protein
VKDEAGLLVDRQHRRACRPPHVEANNRTHLLLKFKVGAVTPSLDPMGLEVGFVEDASDFTGADSANQTLGYHRIAQTLVRPGIARDLEILRRAARRGDDRVAFERCDLDWPPRTRTVLQPRKSPLFEVAKPLTDTLGGTYPCGARPPPAIPARGT